MAVVAGTDVMGVKVGADPSWGLEMLARESLGCAADQDTALTSAWVMTSLTPLGREESLAMSLKSCLIESCIVTMKIGKWRARVPTLNAGGPCLLGTWGITATRHTMQPM